LYDYERASREPGHSPLEFPLFASHNSRSPAPLSYLAQEFELRPKIPDQKVPIASLPRANLLDGVLLLDGEAHPRAVMNDDDRVVSWTREIPDKKLFEHGRLEIDGDGNGGAAALFYSAESDPQSLEDGEIIRSNVVPSSPEVGIQSSPLVSHLDLSFGEKRWPKDDSHADPGNLLALDIVASGVQSIPQGGNVLYVRVPKLDTLLDAINKKLKSQGQAPMKSLYTASFALVPGVDDDQQPTQVKRTYVTLTRASLVMSLSDQGPNSTEVLNLTFKKKLGIDLVLPALFHSFYIDPNVLEKTVSGALFELDPTKREGKGAR
jgi:hypothetical protein